MGFEGKSKRLRERVKLALPVRVHCRETAGHEWVEMSRLIDVTPFGARFSLTRPVERGRLVHLILPMPRQLRCFDHIEDQYRIWALVRSLAARPQPGAGGEGRLVRYEVGVAFTGKNPPASYLRDPAMRYDIESLSTEGSVLWKTRETEEPGAAGVRSEKTRLKVAVAVRIELFGADGRVSASEETVTENISRRGAAVWTTLKAERGRFVRVTNMETGQSLTAAIRAARTGPDGIPRLHMEFIDGEWPLEGIE
ncbi:MAG TPA: hypothetical protein VE713_12625 [Pyrinomonadaceae bacterium]|nr:hypothetical protein [Pyrinomonadaceae bacterium]